MQPDMVTLNGGALHTAKAVEMEGIREYLVAVVPKIG
jgi:hypothetical protein